MAIIMNCTLPHGERLGLWRMDEPVEAFSVLGEVYGQVIDTYSREGRRREVLCTYALLFALTGDTTLRISHLPSGRPVCMSQHADRTYSVSISHTVGWVAVIVSETRRVAVDIEYISGRVQRVVSHFLRPDEPFTQLKQLLVCWCVKETAYKYFSSQHLAMNELRILPFDVDDGPCEGMVHVLNLRSGDAVDIHYLKNSRYVLTYQTGECR